MTEIINRQRKTKLDWQIFEKFADSAIQAIPETENKTATIALISDRQMRKLNREFRGKNSTTDVLSFPFEPDEFETEENTLGDILISVEQAKKQAAENDLPLETEIKQLILHGILHLCGFDH
ncbi:MAG TPA: rRNA maturation RNase YbeY, partial [Pyrinomonadaceae bacterium]